MILGVCILLCTLTDEYISIWMGIMDFNICDLEIRNSGQKLRLQTLLEDHPQSKEQKVKV
jgi:hypothetical protein